MLLCQIGMSGVSHKKMEHWAKSKLVKTCVSEGRPLQAEGTASAKALGWECGLWVQDGQEGQNGWNKNNCMRTEEENEVRDTWDETQKGEDELYYRCLQPW